MSRSQVRQVERQGFARRLHEALAEDDLTAENFARRIDKTLRTVQRWRSGDSEPSASDLMVLAAALERDPSWFYESEAA